MIGRTPGYIVAVRPLRGGAITDFDITERMIRLLLQRVGVSRFNRPRVRDLRAVGHHRGRAAGRHRGGPAGRCGRRPAHRAADGGGHRRRSADRRAGRQHGHRHRRRHHGDRGHLASAASWPWRRCGSARSTSTPRSRPTCGASTASPSASAPPRRSRWRSARPTRRDDEVQAEVRGRDLMSGLPKTVILSPDEVRGAIDDVGHRHRRLGDPLPRRRRRPSWPRTSSCAACTSSAAAACCAAWTSASSGRPRCRCTWSTSPLEAVVLGAGHCIEHYDALKVMFMGARR